MHSPETKYPQIPIPIGKKTVNSSLYIPEWYKKKDNTKPELVSTSVRMTRGNWGGGEFNISHQNREPSTVFLLLHNATILVQPYLRL